MRVERFAHRVGRRMELPVSGRHVVRDEIAKDMLGGIFRRDVARGTADYKTQLHLIIKLLGHPGIDVVKGSGEAGRLFVEP